MSACDAVLIMQESVVRIRMMNDYQSIGFMSGFDDLRRCCGRSVNYVACFLFAEINVENAPVSPSRRDFHIGDVWSSDLVGELLHLNIIDPRIVVRNEVVMELRGDLCVEQILRSRCSIAVVRMLMVVHRYPSGFFRIDQFLDDKGVINAVCSHIFCTSSYLRFEILPVGSGKGHVLCLGQVKFYIHIRFSLCGITEICTDPGTFVFIGHT